MTSFRKSPKLATMHRLQAGLKKGETTSLSTSAGRSVAQAVRSLLSAGVRRTERPSQSSPVRRTSLQPSRAWKLERTCLTLKLRNCTARTLSESCPQKWEDCGDTGILVNFFRDLSDQASRVLESRHLDSAANNKQYVN